MIATEEFLIVLGVSIGVVSVVLLVAYRWMPVIMRRLMRAFGATYMLVAGIAFGVSSLLGTSDWWLSVGIACGLVALYHLATLRSTREEAAEMSTGKGKRT